MADFQGSYAAAGAAHTYGPNPITMDSPWLWAGAPNRCMLLPLRTVAAVVVRMVVLLGLMLLVLVPVRG